MIDNGCPSHDCNILYVARVAPESKSLYKFGKAEFSIAAVSAGEHLGNLHELLVTNKVSRSL